MRGSGEEQVAVFGPFQLHERLGTGGTASVFRARRRDGVPGAREVSVKRLHPHLASDERTVQAFLHEARLAALMDHDNMCRFVEAGEVDGQHFIAMEYIDGTPLNVILREAAAARRPPPLGITLSLLCQLCEALDYAHNRVLDDRGRPLRVVHRDISPSNLMVRPDGTLKLIDLGIAKARITDIETEVGVIKGKLAYMAPEVVAGEPADQRADIFAAGIVAWELLTARRLFPGLSDVEIMDRVLAGGVRPPSAHHHACPPQIDDIVMRALAYRKDDRWSSAASMHAALRAAAAVLHEPITREVIACWLDPSRPRRPTGFEPMRSDAITLVRVRPPSPPRRFPAGTQFPLEAPTPTTRATHGPELARAAAGLERGVQAPEAAPVASSAPVAASAPVPGASRLWALVAGASLALNALLAVYLVVDGSVGAPVRPAGGDTEESAAAPQTIPVAAAGPVEVEPVAAGPVEVEPAAAGPVEVEPAAAGPVEVEPAALTRVSGPRPRSRSTQAPFSARLCLDEGGRVAAVAMLDGPERLRGRIERALRRWRYQPHQIDGRQVAACFMLESELQRWKR